MSDFLTEGITNNRIAAPFSSPPFQHFILSPLGIVPKIKTRKIPGYSRSVLPETQFRQ